MKIQPLDGAYQRVKRARKHLKDIKIDIAHLIQRTNDKVASYLSNPLPVNSVKRQTYATLKRAEFKLTIDENIKILVGETIYNLRAALDYLIYELARLDSGKTQHGTQFPIEDCEKNFRKKESSYLKGINPKHRKSIEMMQPYGGCDWIKSIRVFSNPDKHRELTIVNAGAIIEIPIDSTIQKTTRRTIDVNGSLTFSLTFNDGTSVIPKLDELINMVTKTLDAFGPEF